MKQAPLPARALRGGQVDGLLLVLLCVRLADPAGGSRARAAPIQVGAKFPGCALWIKPTSTLASAVSTMASSILNPLLSSLLPCLVAAIVVCQGVGQLVGIGVHLLALPLLRTPHRWLAAADFWRWLVSRRFHVVAPASAEVLVHQEAGSWDLPTVCVDQRREFVVVPNAYVSGRCVDRTMACPRICCRCGECQ